MQRPREPEPEFGHRAAPRVIGRLDNPKVRRAVFDTPGVVEEAEGKAYGNRGRCQFRVEVTAETVPCEVVARGAVITPRSLVIHAVAHPAPRNGSAEGEQRPVEMEEIGSKLHARCRRVAYVMEAVAPNAQHEATLERRRVLRARVGGGKGNEQEEEEPQHIVCRRGWITNQPRRAAP